MHDSFSLYAPTSTMPQDIAVPPDPPPSADVHPFRLLDLPAELRNRIYEFMVAVEEIELQYSKTAELDPNGLCYASKRCLDSDGQPVEGPMLNICRTSHQVLGEVQPIFAGKTRVSIDIMHPVPRRNSVALAIRFLEDRPHTLQLIRNFELVVEESYDDNLQGYLHGMEAGAWEKLCSLLANRCRLRFLRVESWSWFVGERMNYRESMRILRRSQPRQDIPGWIRQLSSVTNLEDLEVDMQHGSPYHAGRNIAILKFLRDTMLKNAANLKRLTGIKLVLAHPSWRDCPRDRTLDCSLWIENGHSEHSPIKRVKVDPYSWCRRCGTFLKRPSCPCSPNSGNKYCRIGEWARHVFSAATEIQASTDDTVIEPVLRTDDIEAHSPLEPDVWDNERWGGGPLTKFLPKGATEEDFYLAKSLAERGIFIAFPKYNRNKDYEENESDFGDADSQQSLQWDEENDRAASPDSRF